jgi:hypothetical protein
VILILEVGFIRPFVVTAPTDSEATAVVAPERIIDNFLPIPDAESLPVFRMVFRVKLACVKKNKEVGENQSSLQK